MAARSSSTSQVYLYVTKLLVYWRKWALIILEHTVRVLITSSVIRGTCLCNHGPRTILSMVQWYKFPDSTGFNAKHSYVTIAVHGGMIAQCTVWVGYSRRSRGLSILASDINWWSLWSSIHRPPSCTCKPRSGTDARCLCLVSYAGHAFL